MEREFSLRGTVREETFLALENCRPLPAFDKMASVLTPEQFACFYVNYTSASLADVMTFHDEDLAENWNLTAISGKLSRVQESKADIEELEVSFKKKSFNFDRTIRPAGLAITCSSVPNYSQNSKKLITKKARSHNNNNGWKALKRFFVCQGKCIDPDFCPESGPSHSSILSCSLFKDDPGWIKTNQTWPSSLHQQSLPTSASFEEESSDESGRWAEPST